MRRRQGFTILELSIVLAIVALVTSMGFVATIGMVESAKRASTQNKLTVIENALMEFRTRYDRLPCPSTLTLASTNANSALEAVNPGSCTGGSPAAKYWGGAVEGGVPVRTLNLPDEFMYDGWGHKITYTVQTIYTAYRAFSTMTPAQQCGHTVIGAAGTSDVRSASAAYVLISHGSIGHGAYRANGTRISKGSASTDKKYNCRCTDAAADDGSLQYSVQKNPIGEDGATGGFDDMVRYKEFWQLQTDADLRKWQKIPEANLLLGGTYSGGSGAVNTYTRSCYDLKLKGAAGTESANNVAIIGLFTPDNKYVFSNSSGRNCELFNIENNTYVDVSTSNIGDTVSGTGCPTYNSTNIAVMSNNGYLFMSDNGGSAPYLKLWKYLGGRLYPLAVSFSTVTAPASPPSTATAPAAAIRYMAASKDADYVALTGTGFARIYRRTGQSSFSEISTDVAMTPINAGYSVTGVAFSGDGRFFAQSYSAGGTPTINIYRNTAENTFTALSSNPDVSGFAASPVGLAFSSDGQYLAASVLTGAGINNMLKIFRLDFNPANGNVTYTAVTIANGGIACFSPASGISVLKFTPDNKYLYALAKSSTARGGIMVLRQTGTAEYTYKDCAADAIPANMSVLSAIDVFN